MASENQHITLGQLEVVCGDDQGALGTAKAMIEAFFVGMPCAMCVIDEHAHILAANKRGLAHLGARRFHDVAETSWLERLDWHDRVSAETALGGARSGHRAEFNARIAGLEGRVRWCEVSLFRVPVPGAELYAVSWVDITSSVQDERSSRADYISAREDFHARALILVDRSGLIEFANDRAVDWFGVQAGEMMGEIADPEISAAFAGFFDDLQAPPLELRGVKMGTEQGSVFFDIYVSHRFSNNGVPLGVELAIFDCTEREQSNADLERFFDLSPNLFLLTDEEGLFLKTNPAWEHVLGYSPGDLDELTFHDLIHPEDREETLSELGHLLRGGTTPFFPNRFKHRAGHYVWLGWSAVSAQERGLVYAFAFDLSEQKELEQTMTVANDLLKQNNKQLAAFASMASHDLQEPLRKLRAFLSQLPPKLIGAVNEDTFDEIERSRQAADRMSELVRSLRDLSYISLRSPVFKVTPLRRVLTPVLEQLSDLIEVKGATIELDGNWEMSVEVDFQQLGSLLLNLINNAIKFCSPRRKPVVRLGVRREGRKFFLEVRDNGIGIEERFFDKIFEPFEQLHGADIYSGTGMGLAICQRVVERHNGSMRVMSSSGDGSTFEVMMPCRQPTPFNSSDFLTRAVLEKMLAQED